MKVKPKYDLYLRCRGTLYVMRTMVKGLVSLAVFGFVATYAANAQVDQNLKIEASNSNCDGLPEYYQDPEQAYRKITDSRFRLEESMVTSRIQGYRKVFFKSCDRESGFLLIQVDDDWLIFRRFPIELWEAYKESRDLEGFHLEKIKGIYSLVTDPV